MSSSSESVTVKENKEELPYTEDKEIIEQVINDAIAYFTECKKYKMHFVNNKPINAEKQSIDFITQNTLFQLYQKHMENKNKYKNIYINDDVIAIYNIDRLYYSFYNIPSYIYIDKNTYSLTKIFHINGTELNIYGPSRIIDGKEENSIGSACQNAAKYLREEFNKLQLQLVEKNNIIEELNKEIIELKNNNHILDEKEDKKESQNEIVEDLKFIEIDTNLINYKLYYANYDDRCSVLKYLSYIKEDKEYKDVISSSQWSFDVNGLFTGKIITKDGIELNLIKNQLDDGRGCAVRHGNKDTEYWRNGKFYGIMEYSKVK